MLVIDLPEPILVETYMKLTGGCRRRYGVFVCHECRTKFEGRMERLKRMTGLCGSCADIRAGRSRAKYQKGEVQSRLHATWANMKRRCINPVGKEIRIYAGISLCEEWMDYSEFRDWAIANGYDDNLTIDRKDPLGNYEPSNCRFVDYKTQAANRKITAKNKSGYIGVCLYKGAWRAAITVDKKQINIGRFKDPAEAAYARDEYILANNLPHTLNNAA